MLDLNANAKIIKPVSIKNLLLCFLLFCLARGFKKFLTWSLSWKKRSGNLRKKSPKGERVLKWVPLEGSAHSHTEGKSRLTYNKGCVYTLWERGVEDRHTRMCVQAKVSRCARIGLCARSSGLLVHDKQGASVWLALADIEWVCYTECPRLFKYSVTTERGHHGHCAWDCSFLTSSAHLLNLFTNLLKFELCTCDVRILCINSGWL